MLTTAMTALRDAVRHRIWVISDLQQAQPDRADFCLRTAIDDFTALGMPCEQIWYLGDAVEGGRRDYVEAMTRMQVERLGELATPVRYVLGNHEFDITRALGRREVTVPTHTAFAHVPGWKTTATVEDFYFLERVGEYLVVFFSDHADPAGRWLTTHGAIEGDAACYPHTEEAYRALRAVIAQADGPVITVGHYPFAGGNRPSELLNRLLPLPENVCLHCYGHAHIGDAVWAGKDCFRKISYVESQPVPQIDVASLENQRGNAIRSVLLELFTDRSIGVLFRDHERRRWSEAFFVNADQRGA